MLEIVIGVIVIGLLTIVVGGIVLAAMVYGDESDE